MREMGLRPAQGAGRRAKGKKKVCGMRYGEKGLRPAQGTGHRAQGKKRVSGVRYEEKGLRPAQSEGYRENGSRMPKTGQMIYGFKKNHIFGMSHLLYKKNHFIPNSSDSIQQACCP
jgi:hypothetical protein